MANIDSINHIAYIDTKNYLDLNIDKKLINSIIDDVDAAYSLVIFGSYAKGKQKNDSDLDLCFLISLKQDEKRIKPYVENIKLKSIIDIDDHYITRQDFIKMLRWKKENLAKQIFRDNIVVFNHMIYYNTINEAIKNGFKG
jgi:predicted nucleotidyltransferase